MSEKPKQSQSASADLPYQSIFEAVIDGLIVADMDTGIVIEANPAACLMHNFTREEIVGLPLTALIHIKNQNAFSEKLQQIQTGGHLDYRTLDRRRDSSSFSSEWRLRVFDYQGCATLLGIVRDIQPRI